MSISIYDRDLPYDTYKEYDVTFFDDRIVTTVTTTPSVVDSWMEEIERIHRRRLHHLVVGLDVEWRPNFQRYEDNPVATLQLCVGRRCLIFHLIHAPAIPRSLINFLLDQSYTFVGVGIKKDAEKLEDDYGLTVAKWVDLRVLAAETLEMVSLKNAGLKGLAREVLGLEISKPTSVTTSEWDRQWLTAPQIQYACVDAFVSFEIGRILNASTY